MAPKKTHPPKAPPHVSGDLNAHRRTPDGVKVAQTGMNPSASRAGLETEHGLGVADFAVTTDGARARIRLGSQQTDLLTQADLQVIVKALNGAIQQTY
jgi:hypothetical protein